MIPRSEIDFDAIEREAHAMRREAVGQMIDAGTAAVGRLLAHIGDTIRQVQLRMRRAQSVTFFEAQ